MWKKLYLLPSTILPFSDSFSFDNTSEPLEVSQALGNQDVFYTLPEGRAGQSHFYYLMVSKNNSTCIIVLLPHHAEQPCIQTYYKK